MSPKPQLERSNWYGFNHTAVDKEFTGGLTFLNTFCVNGEYYPVAVYRVAKPDRAKGHKRYMLLQDKPRGLVRGMTAREIAKWRWQAGVWCQGCGKVFHSAMVHNLRTCACPVKAMIDGGRDYSRWGGEPMDQVKLVSIDLFTGKIKEV